MNTFTDIPLSKDYKIHFYFRLPPEGWMEGEFFYSDNKDEPLVNPELTEAIEIANDRGIVKKENSFRLSDLGRNLCKLLN